MARRKPKGSMVDYKYTRDEINYETWYNPYMKLLARTMTRESIEAALGYTKSKAHEAGLSHLRTIQKSGSNLANSSQRAKGRNAVEHMGEYRIALRGALEIYDLFPERTLEAR